MVRRYLTFCSLLGLLTFTTAYAQTQTTSTRPNVAFKHILPDELEYVEFIETIAQDHMGFMWFGGRNGIARYDGYEAKRFVKDGTPSGIQSNQVNELLVTKDGALWVATGLGLHLYSPEIENFDPILNYTRGVLEQRTNDIRALLEADDGGLWLGTRSGLIYFDTVSAEFRRYYHEPYPDVSGNLTINTLLQAPSGKIWIGLRTGGLSLFDPATATFEHFRHNPNDPKSLSNNDVREIFLDRDGELWVGTYRGGLNKMLPNGEGFTRYPFSKKVDNDDVWEVVQDRNGIIWIADGGGLTYHDKTTGDFFRFTPHDSNANSLRHRVVRALFLDRAGDLWAGFLPSGVNHLDPQASVFLNYRSAGTEPNRLLGNGVRDTYVDDDGNLWITTGYGLSFFDRANNTFKNFQYQEDNPNSPSGIILMSVIEDRSGYIWFGAWGEGLNRLDRKTGNIKKYPPNINNPGSILGSQPWDMIISQDGNLWIATNEGINRYNSTTDDFTHYKPPKEMIRGQSFYSRAIYEDTNGLLWIGSTRGLFSFDRKTETFRRFTENSHNPYSITDNFVLCMIDDGDGNLWIGTKGGGINKYHFETDRFTQITPLVNLGVSSISGMILDVNKHLWFATHNGLVHYNPKNNIVKTFTKREGLPGNLFNRNAISNTKTGELIIGGTDGLTIFHPNEIWENKYVPPVWPTEFSIFNERVEINAPDSPLTKSISLQKEIVLTHKQSVFSIKFSALNYRSPQENLYQYKLEGFDKTWHPVSKRRIATYTNLDPGEYTMKVRAANNNGVWNQKGATTTIKVLPPYWRSTLAYILYILFFLGVIFFFIQINIRKQTYEREHKLNQSLRNLDKLKDEFLANTSHELRTPLNGIIGLSETMLDDGPEEIPTEQRKQYLKMIHFSGKRLSNLVDDILDFSKLKSHTLYLNKSPVRIREFVGQMMVMLEPLIGGKPVELINRVTNEAPLIQADEKRLQQIFFNLVGNAIKFTNSGSVSVNAKQIKNMLVIDIVDTGIGIPDDKLNKIFESFEQVDSDESRDYGGTGLGLTITQKLIELHGGYITVSSKQGHGSRFSIHLPITRHEQSS